MAASVLINGRFLTQPVTGVQRFAEEIAARLLADGVAEAVLAPPGELRTNGPVPAAAIRQVGRLRGQAWEQCSLPRHVGRRLLLNLGNTAPVLSRRTAITLHDITYLRHPEAFSRAFRSWYRALVPVLLRRAEVVITVSEFSRREIAAHYGLDPARIVVAGNAASGVFAPPAGGGREHLLAVASSSPHKNLALLLEAYARLPPGRPPLLLVGGSAEVFARSALHLPEGARHLGRVDDEELNRLYGGALLFVHPARYEGFGIPPVEAQRCGAPVLAADIAPLREVLGDAAAYVDPDDPDAMAVAIAALVDDRPRRDELSRLGSVQAATHSWDAAAARVQAALQEVLGDG